MTFPIENSMNNNAKKFGVSIEFLRCFSLKGLPCFELVYSENWNLFKGFVYFYSKSNRNCYQ